MVRKKSVRMVSDNLPAVVRTRQAYLAHLPGTITPANVAKARPRRAVAPATVGTGGARRLSFLAALGHSDVRECAKLPFARLPKTHGGTIIAC